MHMRTDGRLTIMWASESNYENAIARHRSRLQWAMQNRIAGFTDLPVPSRDLQASTFCGSSAGAAVPVQTLDLFDSLDPDAYDGFYYDTLNFLESHPHAKRIWKLERAEEIFDARHDELFARDGAIRRELGPRGATRDLITLEYGNCSYMGFYGPVVGRPPADPEKDLDNAALVTIILDDDFGKALFRKYYEEKHGMPVLAVDDDWDPWVLVTWDLSKVHRQRMQRWESRVRNDVYKGKRRYNGDVAIGLIEFVRAFSKGKETDMALPLAKIRSFLGTYEQHLQNSFLSRKKPRTNDTEYRS